MHRLVMGLKKGDGLCIDHINRNKLDNRKCNLRIVTRGQNLQNNNGFHKTSKYRNVFYDKANTRWRVCMSVNNKTKTIGSYKTEEEANVAAIEARKKHMPFAVD